MASAPHLIQLKWSLGASTTLVYSSVEEQGHNCDHILKTEGFLIEIVVLSGFA